MLTLKLFDGFISNRSRKRNEDLHAWARIEFKHDAEYAYNYMLEFGTAPSLGVK